MKYKYAIKNNETGEIRIAEGCCEYEEHNTVWFLTDGNYGCDCNRELEWHRAIDEDDNWENTKCGKTEFSIPYLILEDGTRINVDGD